MCVHSQTHTHNALVRKCVYTHTHTHTHTHTQFHLQLHECEKVFLGSLEDSIDLAVGNMPPLVPALRVVEHGGGGLLHGHTLLQDGLREREKQRGRESETERERDAEIIC